MTWPTKLPLIAILRGIQPQEVLAHVAELQACGFDAIEIPLNSPNWQISLPLCLERWGGQILFGGGTVLHAREVDALAHLGGRLLVTPNTSASVIARAAHHRMISCIGCMTPTEALAAVAAGARCLKLFPAAHMGAGYIRSMLAVLPRSVPVFAVGGVTPENLPQLLQAGCRGAGLGSELYRAGQSPRQTRENAEAYVEAYHCCQGVAG
ncbi:2-dehydro-3-deoxy-6-phosphogalactonate aldolase [Xenophilus sp. AP218F]|nr:2-dehydro-3-deoxy-6-phosphogalactonate aldolase [Xenophilus sp. AP218F]